MKRFPRYLLMFSILMTVFICLPSLAHAQPDPCTDPDVPCPIDGGLIILLFAGVVYGIKKALERRKREVVS